MIFSTGKTCKLMKTDKAHLAENMAINNPSYQATLNQWESSISSYCSLYAVASRDARSFDV